MNKMFDVFDTIDKLCKIYTTLNDDDILKIKQMALCIQSLADLENADVFIDCPTRDSDEAIVVAEAKPSNSKSLYKNSVVGELAIRANEPAVLRTLELGVPTKDLKAVTQENINVRQTVAPIKNNGKVIGVLIVEKDITEEIKQNKHMKMLAEGYEQLANTLIYLSKNESTITEHIDDAIIIFDEDGVVRFKNSIADKLYKKLGYKDNIIGMDYDNISLDDTRFKQVVECDEYEINEIKVGKLYLKVKRIKLNSNTLKLVMLVKDITAMKEKEKELILKSVAIKEIHHRVKNNLQTIASLLRLQARRSDNEDTKKLLNESINRILSIAATHELLAQEGLDEVSIKDVINYIKNNFLKYINDSNKKIDIILEGDNFKVCSDKATSIALILNELMQNSIQYAFVGRDSGKIIINIKKDRVYSKIIVEDNGIGFDIEKVKMNSLGLSIVRSIVKDKLNGDIQIDSGEYGTKILFYFKN